MSRLFLARMEVMDLVIGLLVGLLAFLGALLGHWLSRRSAVETDTWRKREETMRMLRWAVDLAIDTSSPWRSAVGVDILDALRTSELLQTEDVELVQQLTSSIASTMVAALDQEYREEDHHAAEPEGGEPR